MPLAVGIIGCGGITRLHRPGLEKASVRVKWVCDIVKDNATPYMAQFSAAYAADYHEITADPDVQVVMVLTHSATHKAICLAAIAAGKAVICEKTLATNADDALEIVLAAEQKGTIFYTAYMKRFLPAVQKAKELFPSLGTILSTHVRVYQHWGDLWENPPKDGFFHKPDGAPSPIVRSYGGGILVCGGSHILDLVGHFLGRPRRLYATMNVPAGRQPAGCVSASTPAASAGPISPVLPPSPPQNRSVTR
jgi:predicted dehydrogenase